MTRQLDGGSSKNQILNEINEPERIEGLINRLEVVWQNLHTKISESIRCPRTGCGNKQVERWVYMQAFNNYLAICGKCGNTFFPTKIYKDDLDLTEIVEIMVNAILTAKEELRQKYEKELSKLKQAVDSLDRSDYWLERAGAEPVHSIMVKIDALLQELVPFSEEILRRRADFLGQMIPSRKAPRKADVGENFGVKLDFPIYFVEKENEMLQLEKDTSKIKVIEKLPEETGRAPEIEFEATIQENKAYQIRYELSFNKAGKFEIGPTYVTSVDGNVIGMRAPSEILITPAIRFTKRLSGNRVELGKETDLEILVKNCSKHDMLDVKVEDDNLDPSEFEREGNASEMWKCIGIGEERILRSVIVPTTIIGSIKLHPARLTFKDEVGTRYEMESNGLALKVIHPRKRESCPNCGANMSDGAVFCGICGVKL